MNQEINRIKEDIAILQEKLNKLEEIEKRNAIPRMNLETEGKFDIVSYNNDIFYRFEYPTGIIWCKRRYKCASDEMELTTITDPETFRLLDGVWYNDVQVKREKKGFQPTPQSPEETAEGLRAAMRQAKEDGVFDNVIDEPDWYDEVKCDEKDNPPEPTSNKVLQRILDGKIDERGYVDLRESKPMDEVVDRLVKKYQAQKLWNRVRDELGYSIDLTDEIVDLVESWIPELQSAAGSQNVDVELLVDGFNDAIRKMKEMLR